MGAYGVAAGGIGGSSISAWDGLAQTAKSHEGLELQQAGFTQTFAAGETHSLDLRAYANGTDPLSVRFEWVPPDWQTQSIAEAVAAASTANKVVLFALRRRHRGRRPRRERPERRASASRLAGRS